MADTVAIGSLGEPFEMVVELGKIREFARATMSRNADYFDDPFAVSPPTFLMTSAFWNTAGTMPTMGLDIDLARLLHGGQEFVFHGPPPRAGTRLVGQMHVSDAYEKEGRRGGTLQFVEVVTEFRDPLGTLVAETKIVLIITAKAPTEES